MVFKEDKVINITEAPIGSIIAILPTKDFIRDLKLNSRLYKVIQYNPLFRYILVEDDTGRIFGLSDTRKVKVINQLIEEFE